MKKLPIVKIGHPVLSQKTRPVSPALMKDPEFKKFLETMVVTMHDAQGVGLAANQVGAGIQAFVLECKSNPRYPDEESVTLATYLNPKIIKYSKAKNEAWEGCLSIPGYRGLVPRSNSVTFEALTPSGKKIKKTVTGFHARIVQHEIDHLCGFFYVDRMPDLKHWMHLDEMNRLMKSHVHE